tara:strand:+ start:1455 stop:1991 length:537 start_codon:yes stop_codon:yes gene_type:complete
MVEMKVFGIAINPANRKTSVLLRDLEQKKQIDIAINHPDAFNIINYSSQENERNIVIHDMTISIIRESNFLLEKITINSKNEDYLYSTLYFKQKDESINNVGNKIKSFFKIEGNVSDAIALAIREKCSIWVSEAILSELAISVDIESDIEDQSKFKSFITSIEPSGFTNYSENNRKKK